MRLRTTTMFLGAAGFLLGSILWAQPVATVTGPAITVGGGTVATFLDHSSAGLRAAPTRFGVIMDAGALSGLPEHDTDYVLALSPEAQALTPFKVVVLGWRPAGHDPVYFAPHWDVDFYMIDNPTRMGITPQKVADPTSDLYRAVPAQFIPRGYMFFPPPLGAIPTEGWNAVNVCAPTWRNPAGYQQEQLFAFYQGKLIEYNISFGTAYMAKIAGLFETLDPTVRPAGAFGSRTPLALPQAFANRGMYPTQYGMDYNSSTGRFSIFVSDFIDSQSMQTTAAGTADEPAGAATQATGCAPMLELSKLPLFPVKDQSLLLEWGRMLNGHRGAEKEE